MDTPPSQRIRVHFMDAGESERTRSNGAIGETVEWDVPLYNSVEYRVEQYLEVHTVAGVSSMTRERLKHGAWDLGLVAPATPGSNSPGPIEVAQVQMFVRSDGAVEFPTYGLRHHNATPHSIRQSIDQGMVDALPDEVVVYTYMGRGGGDGGSELVWWLLNFGVDLGLTAGVSWIGRKAARYLRNGAADRRARLVARSWAQQRINYPYQLRMVADRRATWASHDFGKLLAISPDLAQDLLRAMGYESNAASGWALGTSKRAKARRSKWMKAEHADPMAAHFEVTSTTYPAKQRL